MNLKRWIAASIVSSLLSAATGCSGASTILRGQSPEADARPSAETSKPRLLLLELARRERQALGWLGERVENGGQRARGGLKSIVRPLVRVAQRVTDVETESDWFETPATSRSR